MRNWLIPDTNRDRIPPLAAMLTLAASVALNLTLSVKLRDVLRATPSAIERGAVLPELALHSGSGGSVHITYGPGERATVFYYYSPTCRWCERNWASVDALIAQVQTRFRFVAVSAAPPPPAILRRLAQSVTIGYGLSPELQRRYGFGGTPHTLVVSPEGRVVQSWVGAYNGDKARGGELFSGADSGGGPSTTLRRGGWTPRVGRPCPSTNGTRGFFPRIGMPQGRQSP
jgi:hypothetical protein